jgi:hypothetical protein
MLAFVVAGSWIVDAAEVGGYPLHLAAVVDPVMGNIEDKEVRARRAVRGDHHGCELRRGQPDA